MRQHSGDAESRRASPESEAECDDADRDHEDDCDYTQPPSHRDFMPPTTRAPRGPSRFKFRIDRSRRRQYQRLDVLLVRG
jgi:hypothetical protein